MLCGQAVVWLRETRQALGDMAEEFGEFPDDTNTDEKKSLPLYCVVRPRSITFGGTHVSLLHRRMVARCVWMYVCRGGGGGGGGG